MRSAPRVSGALFTVLLALVIAGCFDGSLPAQVNVVTANYGNERTNANLQETILNCANVSAAGFGKLGVFPVDGRIFAQPLYVSGVALSDGTVRNVLYLATMHNSV